MSLKKYIGDKAFYRNVLAIAVPVMVQSGITNFVSLLDNIMVGRLGTEEMSGVSIVNQFIFVFNIFIFGAVSAAGIFTAQYYGSADTEGIRYTFRVKYLMNVVVGILGIVIFFAFDDQLISLFLHEGSVKGDLVLTLERGKEYLLVMVIGLLPYAFSQVYASTMRETGETVLPMIASIVAVIVNFLLNCVLIFGLLGAPALGVTGAAIATVVSRFAELLILVVWGHTHRQKCPCLQGAYASLRIPRTLFSKIFTMGVPLMFNEFFWSLSITLRNQCYSTRGLDVVAAQNIESTILNLFNVVYLSLGSSIAIIVGKQLGAGETEKAKNTDQKMIAFSIACAVFMGLILIAVSSPFGKIYNVSEEARSLAAYMMIVAATAMPFSAYAHAAYFTLRTGGKTLVTVLLDSVYMWVIVMPVVFVLAYFTDMGIYAFFVIGQSVEAAKCIPGFIIMRKGDWARSLVSDEQLKN